MKVQYDLLCYVVLCYVVLRCVALYIYMYRERERERYIHIYIYIYRERVELYYMMLYCTLMFIVHIIMTHIAKLAWKVVDVNVNVQAGIQTSKTESIQSLGFLCPPAGARHRSRVLASHLINLGSRARLAALWATAVKTGPGGVSTRSPPSQSNHKDTLVQHTLLSGAATDVALPLGVLRPRATTWGTVHSNA